MLESNSQATKDLPIEAPKRIGWVDAAKGIGILLVVLGHNQINSSVHLFHQLIYSFHMPLFFMLAGMFFKPEYGFWKTTKRRFFSTLRPYLLTLLFIYAIYLFFSTMPAAVVLQRALKVLFYSLPNYYEAWMPLWFLAHLFLLSLFAWGVARLIYNRLGPLWLRLLFLAVMLFGGVLAMKAAFRLDFTLPGKLDISNGLPWSADLLFVTGAFFLGGYELRRSLPDKILASRWTPVVSGVLWLGLCLAFPYELDLAGRRYDFFAVVTVEILAGCLLVLSLSYQLEKAGGRVFEGLKMLGRYSIILLIFHGPIQFFIFYKVMDVLPNLYVAASAAFLAGVGIPVMICEYILRGNPRLAGWFGLPVSEAAAQRKSSAEQQPGASV